MLAEAERLAEAEAAARALFTAPVALAATDPRQCQPELLPGEGEALSRALPIRRREFAAGRAAARRALVALGLPPAPIPMAPDRAPIWPEGLFGSISHSASLCLAVVGRAPLSLGLDLEPDAPLEEDLLPTICRPEELARLPEPARGNLARLIFSAKEATYKALYPLTGVILDFADLEVTLEPEAGRFTARLNRPLAPFAMGDLLRGRFARVADHLVTGVTIGQAA